MKKVLTLGKTERLKSRKLIEELFNGKQSFGVFPFRVFYKFIKEPAITLQSGFGVSTKNFKKAVDRNRVKRLAREAYRLQKNDLHKLLDEKTLNLTVFFIFTGKELPDFKLVNEKMEMSLKRLINLVNERPASNI